jgi:hypothetical protein
VFTSGVSRAQVNIERPGLASFIGCWRKEKANAVERRRNWSSHLVKPIRLPDTMPALKIFASR